MGVGLPRVEMCLQGEKRVSCVAKCLVKYDLRMWPGLPGGPVDENPPPSTGDLSSIPGLGIGRSHMPRGN